MTTRDEVVDQGQASPRGQMCRTHLKIVVHHHVLPGPFDAVQRLRISGLLQPVSTMISPHQRQRQPDSLWPAVSHHARCPTSRNQVCILCVVVAERVLLEEAFLDRAVHVVRRAGLDQVFSEKFEIMWMRSTQQTPFEVFRRTRPLSPRWHVSLDLKV